MLFVLEGVHALPEAIILVADQLLLLDQPLERPVDKFLFLANVIEDPLLKDEKASVDPHRAVVNRVDPRHQAAIPLFYRNHVVAKIGPDTEKAGNFVLLAEVLQLLRKLKVAKAITVVGQEVLFL